MVELHGGAWYLLAQFVSPRTNKREDAYGGPLKNRQKFPLQVIAAVQAVVGDFPLGYRFLADEWLPVGLKLPESRPFARALAVAGVAYLSVMGGTHESFFLPDIVEKCKKPAYMVDLAAAIKEEVTVPVITAGRIAPGEMAEHIIATDKADLICLARVLWADPEWPKKVKEGKDQEIVLCDPECDTCMQLVRRGHPAFCVRWPLEKQRVLKARYA